MFSEILSAIVLLALGIGIGIFTLNYKSKYFDFGLIILMVLCTWIGTNVFPIKIFHFQIRLSLAIQLILFGTLIVRLISLHVYHKRAE